jgi:hypothetical protein
MTAGLEALATLSLVRHARPAWRKHLVITQLAA